MGLFAYRGRACAATTKTLLGDRYSDQDEQLDLLKKLAELRRYEFDARYGDYFQEQTANFTQLHGWNKFWTDTNDEIERERQAWQKWLFRVPGSSDEDVKTTLAIFNACNTMSLTFDQILQTIAMYADRNSFVHMPILNLVSRGQWI